MIYIKKTSNNTTRRHLFLVLHRYSASNLFIVSIYQVFRLRHHNMNLDPLWRISSAQHAVASKAMHPNAWKFCLTTANTTSRHPSTLHAHAKLPPHAVWLQSIQSHGRSSTGQMPNLMPGHRRAAVYTISRSHLDSSDAACNAPPLCLTAANTM